MDRVNFRATLYETEDASCKYVLWRVDGVPINTGTIAMNYVHECSESTVGTARNMSRSTKRPLRPHEFLTDDTRHTEPERNLFCKNYDKSEWAKCASVGHKSPPHHIHENITRTEMGQSEGRGAAVTH